jgi:hypothetical protein
MHLASRASGVLVVAALATMTSSASGDSIEVGGYGGAIATNIHTSYDCPDDPPSSYPCISASWPGNGGRGPLLGAYVRYSASRNIRLEVDLMYARKGYDSGSVVRFHYLEVPLLVRYSTAEGASPRAFVHGGLAPAVLLWCHQSGVAFDNDRHESYPYSNACREGPVVDRTPWTFDLGAVLGGGLGWSLDAGVIELEARIVRSLLDIERDEAGKTVNWGFYLLAGFGRSIGR